MAGSGKIHTVSEFLEGYNRRRSKEFNRLGLSKFLEWRFKTPTVTGTGSDRRTDLGILERLARAYLTEDNDYAGDLVRYAAYLSENYSPLSRRGYISAVKQFLLINDVELRDSQKRMIARKMPRGYHPRTKDEPFTLEMVRKVCDNAPLRLRALVLVLLSSGMRLSEALQIVPEDVDFKARPVTISLRDSYTKTGAPREVFISTEATAALQEWIGGTEDYLGAKVKFMKNLEKRAVKKDRRIFPASTSSFTRLFNAALLRAGYCMEGRGENGERIPIKDRETGRSPIHLHGLRKTFRTQLAKAESPGSIDITEKLMGHEGYLATSYVRLSDEELRAFYLENEHRLMIHPGITPKDRESLKTLAEENAALRERMAAIEETRTEMDCLRDLIMGDPELLKQWAEERIKGGAGNRNEG
jgi:integrase